MSGRCGSAIVAAGSVAALLTACSDGDDGSTSRRSEDGTSSSSSATTGPDTPAVPTGPVVIAHRGASATAPEHTFAAHDRCLDVHPYTVDEAAVMDVLLDAGVDGIFTNRPDVLAEQLDGRDPPPRHCTTPRVRAGA